MSTLALLQGIRFIDSFFPSGGYAFSSGLEAAVQDGAVRDSTGLSRYVEDLLIGGIGKREAIAVKRAHRAVTFRTLHTALEADHELDAMKIGRSSRLASRQTGRQIVKIASERIQAREFLREYRVAIEADRTPGHYAIALGLTLGAVGWTREEAAAGFLYQSAVGFVSAAMKLLPIGQREGQRLLTCWLPLIDTLSREAETRSRMRAWTPIQEIYGMRHDCLEWRLFRS